MLTRHLEVVIGLALALAAVGCECVSPPAHSVPAGTLRPPGELNCRLPGFNSYAELRAFYDSQALTKRVHFFEKGEMQAAVVVDEWGSGDSWDAIYFYAPNGYTKQWVARSLWDAETRGVKVSFNKATGIIHIRSGKGRLIFSANIAALATPSNRDW